MFDPGREITITGKRARKASLPKEVYYIPQSKKNPKTGCGSSQNSSSFSTSSSFSSSSSSMSSSVSLSSSSSHFSHSSNGNSHTNATSSGGFLGTKGDALNTAQNWQPPSVALSSRDKATQLTLTQDQLTCFGCEGGYRMIRGTHGVHSGGFYYEIDIQQPLGIEGHVRYVEQ